MRAIVERVDRSPLDSFGGGITRRIISLHKYSCKPKQFFKNAINQAGGKAYVND